MSEKKSEQADEAEVKVTEGAEESEPQADEGAEAAAEELSIKAKGEGDAEGDAEELSIQSKEEGAAEEGAAEEGAAEEGAAEDQSAAQEAEEEFVWPSDPEHANAVQLLSERVDGVDLVEESSYDERPSYALNLVLVLLILGVGGVGIDLLKEYSSADREARESEKALCKVELHTQQQLIAQKQYGALRIETEPKSAKIERSENGAPFEVIRGKTASGEEIDALTPTTVSNLDINQTYKFRLTFTDTLKRFKEEEEDKKAKKAKKGKDDKEAEAEKKEREIEELKVDYRTEEFYVARYQWILDGATGAFRFQKVIPLVPKDIEHYYSFDWKSGKDMTFESLSECEAHVNSSDATLCRPVPSIKNWETEDARREAEAKKSKKRGRRRR